MGVIVEVDWARATAMRTGAERNTPIVQECDVVASVLACLDLPTLCLNRRHDIEVAETEALPPRHGERG